MFSIRTSDKLKDFVIGHNLVSFSDVPKDPWYKDAPTFVAARDIFPVTVGKEFRPYVLVERGEFVAMLMNALGIEPYVGEPPTDNFEDAANTYYADYLLAAKRLGAVRGVGANLFAPEAPISREEAFVITYNFLRL